jgi:hypothetical protein
MAGVVEVGFSQVQGGFAMKALTCLEFECGVRLFVEHVERLGTNLADLGPLLELLTPASRAQLLFEVTRGPMHQELMSLRIKHGIRRAKERIERGR